MAYDATVRFHRDYYNLVPDLNFSLYDPQNLSERRSEAIGINVCPLQVVRHGRRFTDSKVFLGAYNHNEAKQGDAIAQNYRCIIRQICKSWLNQGRQLIHIPFSLEDDLYAKTILKGLDVHFSRYSAHYQTVVRQISQLSCMISSRFHALLFALTSQTPCFPINYSYKCEWLLQDIGCKSYSELTARSLIDNWKNAFQMISRMEPLVLSEHQLNELKATVIQETAHSLASLQK